MHYAEEQEAAGGNVFPPLWSVDVKASGTMITDFNDHPSVGSHVVALVHSFSVIRGNFPRSQAAKPNFVVQQALDRRRKSCIKLTL